MKFDDTQSNQPEGSNVHFLHIANSTRRTRKQLEGKAEDAMEVKEAAKTLPLGDLANFIDHRGKTPPKTTSGIPLVTAKIIKNNCIQEAQEFIAVDYYDKWMTRGIPNKGDVVFTTEAPMGEVALIKTSDKLAFAQRVIILQGNRELLDNVYLFYSLQHDPIKKRIEARSSGTTVFGIKSAELKKVLINLPPLPEQRAIAATLSCLDDKIEINNRINANLEAQAQAIFKSWFVDFEPFQDGEFVDSELGRIPKGWQVDRFTDCVSVLGGGTPKTDKAEYWNGNIPFFTPKDVSGTYALQTEKYLSSQGLSNCNSQLYPINTVFITARGTVGKIALAGADMAMNQSCYALVGKTGYSQLFIYGFAQIMIDSLKHKSNGAVFNAIVTRDFDSEYVTIPTREVVAEYHAIVAPMFATVLSNSKQNRALAAIRGALLPKLMSGEIEVPVEV